MVKAIAEASTTLDTVTPPAAVVAVRAAATSTALAFSGSSGVVAPSRVRYMPTGSAGKAAVPATGVTVTTCVSNPAPATARRITAARAAGGEREAPVVAPPTTGHHDWPPSDDTVSTSAAPLSPAAKVITHDTP